MGRINERYRYKTRPECNEAAVVKGDKYRFTVLTPALIRLEYSENGCFEDRATQLAVNRFFDVPDFHVIENDGCLRIRTDCMELVYHGGQFSEYTLTARFRGEKGRNEHVWRYGASCSNMGGTARTLDNVDGECELEEGIMSRHTMTAIDDSRSLIIADDGWIDTREKGIADTYLFAYRSDFYGTLEAFYKLTGGVPLLPRYALGNWWSRYYKYSQEEYKDLMLKFEEKGIPFSVAVIDMDWHKTDIDPKYGSGWTGFSWNRDLFPDPRALIRFLKEHGMETTLNLHPAEGIAAHEDAFRAAAEQLGIDAEREDAIPFNMTDPKFVECYFEKVIRPLEEDGVTSWWMDWQQGDMTDIPGLDPLWMLNHYHYADMQGREKRPMLLSRYSGLGSHRYPVGFSGDVCSTWDSLNFQPYFTASASNAGYGWWSHDIGGHMGGIRDEELIVRWVQLGVFSPIMRLHSTSNDFMSKEPWNYGMEAEAVITDFLRLRHRLIPYLYTMNYRAYKEGIPLVQPMYYVYPDRFEAYIGQRNEYFFGSELMVSPITAPAEAVTGLGSVEVWLPDGLWFDFFSPRIYKGGRTLRVYRDIDCMPVFAKAGAIVPMAEADGNDIGNPKTMRIAVFPGADGSFCLYEDDGGDMGYLDGICARTLIEYRHGPRPELTLHKAEGDDSVKVKDRSYIIELRSIRDTDDISVKVNGAEYGFMKEYRDRNLYISFEDADSDIVISFGDLRIAGSKAEDEVFKLLLKARCDNKVKPYAYSLITSERNAWETAAAVRAIGLDSELERAIAEALSLYEEEG
ncbi:MAG TPA: DUF5110 domain-containing protein [Candidatus Ornithomonoglobus merdipullorum]|uniref:DUF5110 domain-containing protein n=1 Tax=Candidatus Ornithomonoglobus merdipullorum TaxID=2840895 RepID=A0A9D1SEM4_9FIRM|nr:DUF5110 domain-containing protein [Candidatus Ornithomonoglobus merdipullorum]